MRGFGDRPLHVEMKDRFRGPGALLSCASPSGAAHSCGAITDEAVTDEIDICIVIVGRPVPMEIIKEGRPIQLQTIFLEIT